MYLAYISYFPGFYQTRKEKMIEIGNEYIFLLIQYCFVLLIMIYGEATREQFGNLIIVLTSILLAANLLIIIHVSCRPLVLKLRHKHKLKQAIKRHSLESHSR